VKSHRFFAAAFALYLAVLACNFPVGTTPTPEKPPKETKPVVLPTPEIETLAPAPTVSPLTVGMLKNGTYLLPESKETVTLVDGKFDRAESNENILHVELRDPIAFGDLNADGAEDAAFLLSENMGGTGFFVSLVAIRNSGGLPVQAASRFIEDRPQINGLTIMGGRIAADLVIHGVDDPLCCPNFPAVETFRLAGDLLVLKRFTSKTSGGDERAITITGPVDGSAASGSVQIIGSVTIAPFENTLAYRFFAGGAELGAGSFLVDAGEMGGPGTFNVSISLAGIPAGIVRLEISDLSAADGSMLAMDSVLLKVG
jgi:hypothetical protein